MVLGMATMSVLSSHDYLSWNRTRWQAIRHLTAIQKIDANRIDGGYEFNGLYTATRDYIQQPGKSWWYVNGDDYVIASGPLPGRTVIGEYPVPQWLPLGPRRIVILQRNYH